MDPGFVRAFCFGALSAVSLPVGALIGCWCRPAARVVAAVMAFGAGALLAALTLELVGPALAKAGFAPLALGVSAGCLSFVGLNAALDRRGAFMRRAANLARHAHIHKRRRAERVVGGLSRAAVLRSLPPEKIQAIVSHVRERTFAPGAILCRQGDHGDAMYVIEDGSVSVVREENGHAVPLATRGTGDVVGEMALLTGEARIATVTAVDPVRALEVHRDDFERLLRVSPGLAEAVAALVESRKADGESQMETWQARAMHSLDPAALRPSAVDIHQAVHEHGGTGGAGVAIYLGACLDGVGEALVIGATTVGAGISLPLIGAIILSNLPEAMSSAATMQRHGAHLKQIFWMWMSLVLLTGLASAAGHVLFAGAPHAVFALIEGAAAGAMLAMVAQTMLPEAFEQGGGTAVGILTVAGFLAAIWVRTVAPGS